MPRDRLLETVAPPSLGHHSTSFKGGLQARQTLNRWTQIGLFHEADGQIHLRDGLEKTISLDVDGVLYLGGILRNLILLPENNDDLGSDEPGAGADFTFAVSWMLAQDPFYLTSGSYEEVISPRDNEQFQQAPRAFRNDTRWDGFREWAPALGFGWISHIPKGNTFVPDPTAAVGEQLPTVFGQHHELPQGSFLGRLAEQLPVVDGGKYRRLVESRLGGGTWRPTAEHEVSPSLTLALLHLEAEGRIKLEERSDAPFRTLLGHGFREVRKVSHVLHGQVT